MIDELIIEIKKAEKKAEDLVRAATVQAKELIIETTASAELLLSKASEDIKELKKSNFAKAEELAKINTDKIISAAQEAAETLKSECVKTIDKATDLVVGRILNKYATN